MTASLFYPFHIPRLASETLAAGQPGELLPGRCLRQPRAGSGHRDSWCRARQHRLQRPADALREGVTPHAGSGPPAFVPLVIGMAGYRGRAPPFPERKAQSG
jgi:hypothetical protein